MYQMDHIWGAPSRLKKSLALIFLKKSINNYFETGLLEDPVHILEGRTKTFVLLEKVSEVILLQL